MILVIGYGNPLRSDDAIGQHLALMMEERLQVEALQVITAYQLTPELVEPIRQTGFVVFIDARVGTTPGEIVWEIVQPASGNGAFTHHVSPASLLGAAHNLYGATPAGILISIVGADFEYGSELSDQLNHRLPDIAVQVETIITSNVRVPN